MAWIESHQSLHKHPKTLALTSFLKADKYKVIGHLHALWWWALDLADTDGTLPPGTSAAAVADGAGWPIEDAASFIKGLRRAGFMEKNGFVLHDWPDYAGSYYGGRRNASEKGAQGNHQRWHVNRGITEPTCEFCRGESPSESGSESGGIAQGSHPPSLPPTILPTDRNNPPTATNLTAKMPFSDADVREILSRFPGINVNSRWKEYVIWVGRERDGEREPKDPLAHFISFLKAGANKGSAAAV